MKGPRFLAHTLYPTPPTHWQDGGEMSAEAASSLETLLEPYHAATNMPAVLARVFSNVIFASLLSQACGRPWDLWVVRVFI